MYLGVTSDFGTGFSVWVGKAVYHIEFNVPPQPKNKSKFNKTVLSSVQRRVSAISVSPYSARRPPDRVFLAEAAQQPADKPTRPETE